jgi:hypothetical protein
MWLWHHMPRTMRGLFGDKWSASMDNADGKDKGKTEQPEIRPEDTPRMDWLDLMGGEIMSEVGVWAVALSLVYCVLVDLVIVITRSHTPKVSDHVIDLFAEYPILAVAFAALAYHWTVHRPLK